MQDKTYNGWTNYETWRVKLEIIDNWEPVDHLAPKFEPDLLKEYVEDVVCSDTDESRHLFVSRSFMASYALAFLDAVNYTEISKALRDDYKEHEEHQKRTA
ncbi:MAG: hypothetical protein CMC70_04725 [Flavobacteriaceae bacterium]|nr:hypothetical protein [Flavobacteriaceae bacterium]|tara:strand:+ start:694 stop:996 length:303 start_codon:yes stop_codon:yes gene_type:complete